MSPFIFRQTDEENQRLNRNLNIPISWFASIHATEETAWEHCPESQGITTWGGLVVAFTYLAMQPYEQKCSAFLFSPTLFWPRRRLEVFATVARMLVIDADHGLDFGTAYARLREAGIEAVIYTTGSNVHGDRFRIVVPLAEPVGMEDQARAVRAFCRWLYDDPSLNADTSKMNGFSIFYIPAAYEMVRRKDMRDEPAGSRPVHELFEAVSNRFEYLPGAVYEAHDWIEGFPAPEPPPEVQRTWEAKPNAKLKSDFDWHPQQCSGVARYRSAGKGGHHKGLFGMINSLAMYAYNMGYDLQAGELAAFAEGEQRAAHPKSPMRLGRSTGKPPTPSPTRLGEFRTPISPESSSPTGRKAATASPR